MPKVRFDDSEKLVSVEIDGETLQIATASGSVSSTVVSNIKDVLVDVPDAKQRANIKGVAISKIGAKARQNVQFSGADYDIEIVSLNPIDKGVEVFARAWNPDGSQIGFGKDGSVDIERFRFFNPPVLIQTGTDPNAEEGEDDRILEENPELAILQSISHTISVKKQKFGSENIVSGKVGNTTTTVYPDADPESTSVDGQLIRSGVDETWATIIAADGTDANDTDAVISAIRIDSSSTTDQWARLYKSAFLFDTSGIGSGQSVSSATLSLYGQTGTADNLSITPNINIVDSNPASNTALAAGDFDTLGSTVFSTAIAYGSWSTSAYNDFSLNASGISNISVTGVSKFGGRNENYDIDASAPTWSSSAFSRINCQTADTTGTSQDPKLVVEHEASAGGGGSVPTLLTLGVG